MKNQNKRTNEDAIGPILLAIGSVLEMIELCLSRMDKNVENRPGADRTKKKKAEVTP